MKIARKLKCNVCKVSKHRSKKAVRQHVKDKHK